MRRFLGNRPLSLGRKRSQGEIEREKGKRPDRVELQTGRTRATVGVDGETAIRTLISSRRIYPLTLGGGGA